MKIKRYLYISDAQGFLRDPQTSRYAISSYSDMGVGEDPWIECGEIEFEIDVDTQTVIDTAKATLDADIGRHTAAINVLEQRKSELLAITCDEPREPSHLRVGPVAWQSK